MTDLSPAAQAVLDAVEDDCIHPTDTHRLAAAALCAAVDQVLPETPEPRNRVKMEFARAIAFIGAWNVWNAKRNARREFLAIADELEGRGDG